MQVILTDTEAQEFFGLRSENTKLKAQIVELQMSLSVKGGTSTLVSHTPSKGNSTHLEQLKAKQDELEIPEVFRMPHANFPSIPLNNKTVQSALPTMGGIQKKERFNWQPHMNTINSIVNEERVSRRTFKTLLSTFPQDGVVTSKFLRAKLLALGVAIDDNTGNLSWDMSKSNRHPIGARQ